MFEQKRVSAQTVPTFVHNAKGLEYVTGNPTLDGSKFTNGAVVEPGTAIYKQDNDLYDLVSNAPEPGEGESAARLRGAVLTTDRVVVEDNSKNYHTGAISKGNVTEALTTGVTEQFKASNGLFFWY